MADDKKLMLDESQSTDRPFTDEKTEKITRHIHLISPDLSTKDAGKYLNAIRIATNVYNPNRQPLYDLYTYILALDNYLSGLINKRHISVLNKKIVYKKGEEKQDTMDTFIRSRKFRELLECWLWDQQYGLGGTEFTPGKQFDWKEIPRKHIKPKWQLITEEQSGGADGQGYDYTKYANIIINDLNSLGLLQTCALAAAYKKDALSDWAEFIEVYGRPIQVMWYDAFNPQVLYEIEQIQKQAGAALRVKLPKGTEFELKEPSGGNSTGDLQMQFIELLNKEMAVRQLGGTETTGTSKGSGHAQSEIHYRVEQEVMKYNMDYIIDRLNDVRFINVLKSYGIPVSDDGCFEFDREVDTQFMKDKWEVDKGLIIEAKLPVSKDYLYETYNIPKPKAGDEILELTEEIDERLELPSQDTEPSKAKKPKKKTEELPPVKEKQTELSDSMWQRFKDFFAEALRQ